MDEKKNKSLQKSIEIDDNDCNYNSCDKKVEICCWGRF